jgi:hypothetical protein
MKQHNAAAGGRLQVLQQPRKVQAATAPVQVTVRAVREPGRLQYRFVVAPRCVRDQHRASRQKLGQKVRRQPQRPRPTDPLDREHPLFPQHRRVGPKHEHLRRPGELGQAVLL